MFLCDYSVDSLYGKVRQTSSAATFLFAWFFQDLGCVSVPARSFVKNQHLKYKLIDFLFNSRFYYFKFNLQPEFLNF